ncbi:MAG: phytanoyl-CoA dioxygenase family protein [Rubripirellula sp.]|nr:phytanoyl-CoA dioxygenase family protein [Rubripirellula sp.]
MPKNEAPDTCQPANEIPLKSYGIIDRDMSIEDLDLTAEEIRRLGFSVLDVGFTAEQIESARSDFSNAHASYVKHHGLEKLRDCDEHNTIRMPMAGNPLPFRNLALNSKLLSLVERLIKGQFILNQQNGIINPANKEYNQGKWHRDVPYQHFVTSTPLAINALYCVDDFTLENGSTWVLPASHKEANYPSERYIKAHAQQLHAKAGQYVVLDCMLFHSGGSNHSTGVRRAVNHVYTIPFFKQQIRLAGNIDDSGLSDEHSRILGLNGFEPQSIDAYLESRSGK